jgi:hypothetical protein
VISIFYPNSISLLFPAKSTLNIEIKTPVVGRNPDVRNIMKPNLRNISYGRDIYGIDPKVLAQAQKKTL